MKKVLSVILACFLLGGALVLAACGNDAPTGLSGSVTIEEWLEKQGEGEDFTLTVKVVELLNPYYARVEDDSGSVLLFGLWEDGEPKAFAEKGVDVGDTIVIKNPVYNVFEDNVEMKECVLVEKK
ncbi:MAG: hypothetical protein IK104_03275 [Clostridia bacterium]|nr:hypothetical protein [Clostridia bacterium]